MRRTTTQLSVRPDWFKKSQEEDMVIVNFTSGEDVTTKMSEALKRAGMKVSVNDVMLPTSPSIKSREAFQTDLSGASRTTGTTFSKHSLRDISRLYHFSLGYLGDYVCSLGIEPPLDIDIPVGEYMSGEQLYSLLTAVTTVSPHDVNSGFSDNSATLVALAKDLDVNVHYLANLCGKMDVKVPLPYGIRTPLHNRLVRRIVEEIEGRRKYEGFEVIPPFRQFPKEEVIEA